MASKRPENVPFSVTTNVTEESIRASAKRINGEIHRTPVMTSRMLNQKTEGRNLFFKCEHLQRTGSFKVRGALSAVTKLLEAGTNPSAINLVTCSSGNFGTGLSYAARSSGIENVTVLMSANCSPLKKAVIQSQGAKIQLYHEEQEMDVLLTSIVKETGALFISSGQTYDVMSGQGTVGLELMNQVPELDAIVVPVGGGGLISGIAAVAKALNPNIKIIGAEPSLSNSCELSLHADSLCRLNADDKPFTTIADGLRVSIGSYAWPIIREHVDHVISVSEDEIKNATLLGWHYLKQCVEPSAGVALAAVLSKKFESVSAEVANVGVILTGGNSSQECIGNIVKGDTNAYALL